MGIRSWSLVASWRLLWIQECAFVRLDKLNEALNEPGAGPELAKT